MTAPGHGHGHGHGHALEEAPADVIGYVAGRPVPHGLLEERLTALRSSDRACVLPHPDTREGRQLRRWVAQVILTEELCKDELVRRRDTTPAADVAALDISTAIAVGSITAAALAGSADVRRVAELVTADVRIDAAQLDYAADVLGVDPPRDPDRPEAGWHADLVTSARLEAFGRWLNGAMHDRVQLVRGLEHPGDSNQPDNLHRH